MAGESAGGPGAKQGVALAAMAVVAVACCAALPLVAALAGGLAIGTVLGVGAGAVAAAALLGFAVARWRRRGRCEP